MVRTTDLVFRTIDCRSSEWWLDSTSAVSKLGQLRSPHFACVFRKGHQESSVPSTWHLCQGKQKVLCREVEKNLLRTRCFELNVMGFKDKLYYLPLAP